MNNNELIYAILYVDTVVFKCIWSINKNCLLPQPLEVTQQMLHNKRLDLKLTFF